MRHTAGKTEQTAEAVGAVFSAEYKDCDNMQKRVGLQVLRNHWDVIRHKKRILEIGCGSGYIANFLAKNLLEARVCAIDKSAELIDSAKQIHARNNLEFQVMDATALNEVEKYDLIISFFLFHFIPDKNDLFRRLLKATSAQANILVIIPLEDKTMLLTRQNAVKDIIQTDLPRFSNKPQLAGIDKDKRIYEEIVTDYSDQLSAISMDEKIFDPHMTSDDFSKFIRGIAIELRTLGLTEDEKSAYVKTVVDRMLKRVNGEIDFTLHYFQLTAKRKVPAKRFGLFRFPNYDRESVSYVNIIAFLVVLGVGFALYKQFFSGQWMSGDITPVFKPEL